jgi:hypothetical protein
LPITCCHAAARCLLLFYCCRFLYAIIDIDIDDAAIILRLLIISLLTHFIDITPLILLITFRHYFIDIIIFIIDIDITLTLILPLLPAIISADIAIIFADAIITLADI